MITLYYKERHFAYLGLDGEYYDAETGETKGYLYGCKTIHFVTSERDDVLYFIKTDQSEGLVIFDRLGNITRQIRPIKGVITGFIQLGLPSLYSEELLLKYHNNYIVHTKLKRMLNEFNWDEYPDLPMAYIYFIRGSIIPYSDFDLPRGRSISELPSSGDIIPVCWEINRDCAYVILVYGNMVHVMECPINQPCTLLDSFMIDLSGPGCLIQIYALLDLNGNWTELSEFDESSMFDGVKFILK